MNHNKMKQKLFSLKTRRFGTCLEIITRMLFNLKECDYKYANAVDSSGKLYEICGSTCNINLLCRLQEDNIIDFLSSSNDEETHICNFIDNNDFNCNFNQIKPNCFDYLIYVLCFHDFILFFKISSNDIVQKSWLHHKQHKMSTNECQFNINRNSLVYHINNHLLEKLSYEELFKKLICLEVSTL